MFDPVRICEILNEECVDYVVVGGYEGWRAGATVEEVSEGLRVVVASLDDLIDSKQAANRAKDHASLPYLESLRDELRRQGES
jgi:molybdopterin/thiamine biosynthesis adenylyltransferase